MKIPIVILLLFIGMLCYGQAQEIPEWKPETKQLDKMLKKLRGLNKELDVKQSAINPDELSTESLSLPILDKDSLNSELIEGLKSYIDSLKVSSEFAMGQEETIRLSKKMGELKQELEVTKTNLKNLDELNAESLRENVPLDKLNGLNQQKTEYEALFKEYEDELKSLDKSLEDYVTKHPKVKALQNEYLNNKALEAKAFGLDVNQLQTFEKVEEIISNRIGGAKEELGSLVNEKIISATEELSELKSQISSDLERGMVRDTNGDKVPIPFTQRLNFSSNLSILRGDPAAIDVTANIGYRFSGPWSLGVGGVYRTALGTGWDEIDFQTQGWGYRAFLDYQLTSKFFMEFAYESYNQSGGNANGALVGDPENAPPWQDALLIGIGVQQPINKGFSAHLMLLYNLTQRNSQFSSPFIMRFGIDLRKKNK